MYEKRPFFKDYLKYIFNELLVAKKYILIFLISLIFFTLTFFKIENYTYPKAEILLILSLFIFGTILIIYSLKHKNNLHKITLVTILIFGILAVFTTPTLIVCDENEHFARSDMISFGELIPHYNEGKGYTVSSLVLQLEKTRGKTILESDSYNDPINNTKVFYNFGFPQNPFYGYLISGFGILLAKLLDVSIIYTLWFGRLFNLILYSIICTIAVKKAPVYKMPLFVICCLPLAIFQAASFSADGFINCFCILSISYFIYMYKTSSTINHKDLSIFFISIFLVSLFRFPYALFAFFIFLIPKEKFSSNKLFIISRIIPILILIISVLYSLFYAAPQLKNTGRQEHFIQDNVSPSGQISYMINNPLQTFTFFSHSANLIPEMVIDIFRFSHCAWIYSSLLLSMLYLIFFSVFCFNYDHGFNLKKSKRLIIGMITFLIYMGIIFIQYLSWASIGYNQMDMLLGVYSRYYIPLLALFPLIFSLSSPQKIKNFDLKVILTVIIFLSGTLILTISTFY